MTPDRSIRYTVSVAVMGRPIETLRFLECLRNAEWDGAYEVILHDNGSSEDLRQELLDLQWPELELHFHETNLGFGKAHNLSAKKMRGDYLLVSNNDLVFEPGAIRKLREALETSTKNAIAGPAGKDICNSFDSRGMGCPGHFPEYIEGAFLMIPKWAIQKLGYLFSEEFYLAYYEDSDLSLRAREAGFKLVNADVQVKHIRESTSNEIKRGFDLEGIKLLNRVRFAKRWGRYLRDRNFRFRISVKRTGAIGDVLWVTPLIDYWKRAWPECRIRIFTGFRDAIITNPQVDQIGRHDARGWKDGEDLWVDLDDSYERTPEVNILQAYARDASVPMCKVQHHPIYNVQDSARTWAALHGLDWAGMKRRVAIHPGPTLWPGRNWPEGCWLEVAKEIKGMGFETVQIGRQDGIALPRDAISIQLAGLTTFSELAGSIEACEFFVGLDSSPSTLAQAFLRRSVVLFGCIDPKTRLFDTESWNRAIWPSEKDCGCRGCHHVLPAPRRDNPCFRGDALGEKERGRCMKSITPRMVLDAFEAISKEERMGETSKVRSVVLQQLKDMKVLEGHGLDVGCQEDPLTDRCYTVDHRPGPKVKQLCDACLLPFPDNFFDWVWSSHCLEDIHDWVGALREWRRVLRPGGILGLYVPEKNLYKGCNVDHVVEFDQAGLVAGVLSAGKWTIIRQETRGHGMPPGPGQEYSVLVFARKEI